MEVQVIASGSTGNAYLIDDGRSTLLLECGVRLKEIQSAANFSLHKIAACLVSHEHNDHSKAALDLMRRGIDCYASAGTMESLKVIKHHRAHGVEPFRAFEVGTYKIMGFPVEHDAAEPFGFLIESVFNKKRLLFFTDTYYLKYTFKNINVLMVECNYSREIIKKNVLAELVHDKHKDRVIRSHMSIETLLEFITASAMDDLDAVYLLHMSDSNSDEAEFKKKVQAATGAQVVVC